MIFLVKVDAMKKQKHKKSERQNSVQVRFLIPHNSRSSAKTQNSTVSLGLCPYDLILRKKRRDANMVIVSQFRWRNRERRVKDKQSLLLRRFTFVELFLSNCVSKHMTVEIMIESLNNASKALRLLPKTRFFSFVILPTFPSPI